MQPGLQRRPWHEMRRLQQEMEQLFAGLGPALRWSLTGEYPPINFTRTDDRLTVDAACPGVDRATLEVSVVGDAITIRGQTLAEPDSDKVRYHRRERPAGSFTRAISVSERLNPESAEATYKDGILRLNVARAPETAPKRIEIRS